MLRSRSLSPRHLGSVPSCAGLLTRLACARARNSGIALPPILRRAHLTMRQIADEDLPLSVSSQIECLNLIAAALDDRLLGFHLALITDLRRLGFFHYVTTSSDTLGDALRRAVRYSVVVNEGIGMATVSGSRLRVKFRYAGVSRLSDRHQIEGWIGAVVRASREMTARELQPVAVRIMHQRIPESSELDSFLGCTVEFGADSDEVVFSGEVAALPVVSADRYLNKLLIQYFERALTRRRTPPGTIREDVENAIATLLPHAQARLDDVAEKLGSSPRTLRRKLAAEGVTFATILEELRLKLAQRYLAEQSLSVSRIAWLLGYTEVSAFSHAFRRWTGHNPRAARGSRAKSLPPVRTRRRAHS